MESKVTQRWVWVSLSYATYGIALDDDDMVVDAAPIARWMIGKRWIDVQAWLRGKGGTWRDLPGGTT
jgi:hypothetical protein